MNKMNKMNNTMQMESENIEGTAEERIFEGYLVLNFRSGRMRILKDINSNKAFVGLFDIPIKFKVRVEIPIPSEFKEKVVKVPKEAVRGMLLESLN